MKATSSLIALSNTLTSFVLTANAFSIPFSAIKRDQISDDTFSFQNDDNIYAFGRDIYTAKISTSGQDFLVQIDTGSSDLWLDTTGVDLSNFTNTGVNGTIAYGDGTVAFGPILTGDVIFGNFTVSQAFISAPGTDATSNGDTGLLGVGPPALSTIKSQLENTSYSGNMLLENIFASEPGLPSLITLALSRSESTGTTNGGIFTIGEIASNFSTVTASPALNVTSTDRWIVLMDGIIVNGQKFSGNSSFSVQGQSEGQTLANLDSGSGLAQLPKAYFNAIYASASVPGSSSRYDQSTGALKLPCDTKLNVSFVFGGLEYPVHPVDTVQALVNFGEVTCYSGFTLLDPDPTDSDGQDLILGDSFLRNVYAVFNLGSFVNESTKPNIQLLSTTNAEQAYAEFDTLSAQRNQSLTGGSTNSNTTSSNSGSSSAVVLSSTANLGGLFILAALGSAAALLFRVVQANTSTHYEKVLDHLTHGL